MNYGPCSEGGQLRYGGTRTENGGKARCCDTQKCPEDESSANAAIAISHLLYACYTDTEWNRQRNLFRVQISLRHDGRPIT